MLKSGASDEGSYDGLDEDMSDATGAPCGVCWRLLSFSSSYWMIYKYPMYSKISL